MADDNFKKNKKDAEDYYQTQLRIAKVIKEQTESFTTYADAVKKIRENAKSIKETQKEINRLTVINTKESLAQAEVLRREVDYLVKVNKELTKLGPLLRATGKSLGSWGMDKLVGLGKNLLETYNKIDGSARRTTIQMGMSYRRMEQFRNVSIQAADNLALMGIEGEKAGEMLAAFADESGRQLMMTEQSIIGMGALAKRTGMAETEVATMAGQMEAFGLSSGNSVKMMESIADISDKMGVNTSKIMKKVQQNIGLLNRLSFKDGVKGMAKMAMYAEKYKLSMEASAGFAEKVMRPEGAIEAAANLQVLGGSLASLGDPFKLMAEARNDPEAFAKNITKAASATAEWDAKLGEFKVSAYEMDRLREVSEATGISLEELVKTAKQGAKINMFENAIKLKGDDREFLSSIMEADEKGAFVVNVDGNKEYLKDMSATRQQDIAAQLKADKDGSMARQEAAQTTQELIINTLNALQAKLLPAIKDLDDKFARPLVQYFAKQALRLAEALLKFAGWVPYLIAALIAVSMGWPILTLVGKVLSTFWTVGKGVVSSLGSLFKSGASTAAGGTQSAVANTVQGGAGAAGNATGGMTGAQTAMQGQAAKNAGMGSMMKSLGSAAQILAIAGAMYILSEALINFNQVEWESLAKGGVALTGFGIALYLLKPALNGLNSVGWEASLIMLALGASILMLSFGLQMMAQIPILTLVVSLLGLIGVLMAFSLLAPVLAVGEVVLLALGAALLMIGAAVLIASYGIAMIVDSFTNLFKVVNLENMAAMFMFGPALSMVAIGIFALAASLVALGAAYLMGGFMGIFALAETGEEIQKAFRGIDTKSLAISVVAINRLDMKKVHALREMATALSMASMFGGGFKVEFDDIQVKGDINLKGDKRSTEMVFQEPYLTKLKNLVWEATSKGRKGGKT